MTGNSILRSEHLYKHGRLSQDIRFSLKRRNEIILFVGVHLGRVIRAPASTSVSWSVLAPTTRLSGHPPMPFDLGLHLPVSLGMTWTNIWLWDTQ